MPGDFGISRWELIPARTVYETFRQIVTPTGFQTIRNGVLARQASEDFFHVITLAAYKGGQYGLQWGLSLTYLPHSWTNELRWHRTLKSVHLDLWDRLIDLPDDLKLTKLPADAYIPSRLHGVKSLEENLKSEWQDLKTTIAAWFDRVRDLPGVLAISSQQMQRTWRGPQHWPPPALVHTFTLSRMGRLQEAINELRNEIINEGMSDPDGLLESALEKVATN